MERCVGRITSQELLNNVVSSISEVLTVAIAYCLRGWGVQMAGVIDRIKGKKLVKSGGARNIIFDTSIKVSSITKM